MAEREIFGLPKIIITFKSRAATAISRSARGIGVLILNDENIAADEFKLLTLTATDTLPTTGYTERNIDIMRKALLGTPLKLLVYAIPPATRTVTREVTEGEGDDAVTTTVTEEVAATVTQATILKEIADAKWNYIAHPTGSALNQQDLASWVKSQRTNRHKTFKAVVANVAADSYGVINFTTGGIKVVNPAWTDAYEAADGDETQIPASIPHYQTFTAAEYTARILGALCGIGLDRSATFYELDEVVSCDSYDDIDTHINDGELCLFDQHDGNGVKIARACNSLKTFTTDVSQDFRYIKIVEGIDLIHDDIADTFRDDYVGKVNNTYENKMLFINAIHAYFNEIVGTVLDPNANNRVEIDIDANADYASLRGIDMTNWTDQRLREINTGAYVFLRGYITMLNAFEELKLNFTME